MNDVKLNNPIYCNRKYTVFLDSQNKFSFKNKRQALDFIVRISKLIDESILLVSEEVNSLEELYRLYYLADRDYKFRYDLNNILSFINNRLEWFTTRSGSENHDAILFTSLINCFDELIYGFTSMENKACRRRDTITRRRCALKAKLVRMFKEQFFSSGIKPEAIKLILKKVK